MEENLTDVSEKRENLTETKEMDSQNTQEEESNDHSANVPALLSGVAEDYADYLFFNSDVESMKFNDSVETMLTKLDEFFGLMDMIRSDTTLCLYRTVPEIQAKCDKLQIIFTKIDQLEAFVSSVKQNVTKMEESVSQAEDEMGSFSGLKKMFTSLTSRTPKKSSNSNQRQQKDQKFNPPQIFTTEDFFEQEPESDNDVFRIELDEASLAALQTTQAFSVRTASKDTETEKT